MIFLTVAKTYPYYLQNVIYLFENTILLTDFKFVIGRINRFGSNKLGCVIPIISIMIVPEKQ